VGYGGGVCQLSTAIFHAAMGLPMLIGEWEIHQKIGVNYALAGLDAAVSAYSDLVFQNLLLMLYASKRCPRTARWLCSSSAPKRRRKKKQRKQAYSCRMQNNRMSILA
jgi:vancomycin resistance protein YoaR